MFLSTYQILREIYEGFFQNSQALTKLLEKDVPFELTQDCLDALNTLKKTTIRAPIMAALDWAFKFELISDSSDFVVGVILSQRKDKHFELIYYASKIMADS